MGWGCGCSYGGGGAWLCQGALRDSMTGEVTVLSLGPPASASPAPAVAATRGGRGDGGLGGGESTGRLRAIQVTGAVGTRHAVGCASTLTSLVRCTRRRRLSCLWLSLCCCLAARWRASPANQLTLGGHVAVAGAAEA